MNEVGRIIARLRLAAASAEAQADELGRRAKESRALADELTANPAALASVRERAIALFTRPRGTHDVEFAVRRATSSDARGRNPISGAAFVAAIHDVIPGAFSELTDVLPSHETDEGGGADGANEQG